MATSYLTGRLTSHWVRIDGREMHYLRSTGPEPPNDIPVVLLHGIMSGCSFVPVGEIVAPYHRVYIPDMPGVGASEAFKTTPTLSDLVAALIAWMDRCGLTKVHIAAQSFGCNMAVEAAVLHPERVASLTLQALTLEPERRNLPMLIPFWLLAELREIPKGKTKKRGQEGVSARGGRALVKALLEHEIEQRLPQVRCPSLVLHGTHDFIVSRKWAQLGAQLIPNGYLLEVPRGTHSMNARQPQIYADAFLEFASAFEPEHAGLRLASVKGESHVA